MQIDSFLTEFGEVFSRSIQKSQPNPLVSPEDLKKVYKLNKKNWKKIKSFASGSRSLIIVGPGAIDDHIIQSVNNLKSDGSAFVMCSQWSNFRENLIFDFVASCHVLPLMSSLIYKNKPKVIFHGVYSKVPPILQRSCTVTWSDPFLRPENKNGLDVTSLISKWQVQDEKFVPRLEVPRNAMSFCIFVGLYLGFRSITLVGFDPLNPQYFFETDDSKRLEIAECVIKTDPWIAAWDGRNQRIPPKNDTIYRQNNSLKKFLVRKTRSAVGSGWRLNEMSRGLLLVKKMTNIIDADINYIGHSEFMAKHGITHLDV